MPYKLSALSVMDELAEEVEEVGSMNTVVRVEGGKLRGRNTDVDGIREALLATLGEEERARETPWGEGRSAFISTFFLFLLTSLFLHLLSLDCAFPWLYSPKHKQLFSPAVGGGGTTRAAIFALSQMHLSPIYLLNRDADETAAIISTPAFQKYDLRPLDDEVLAAWTDEDAKKVRRSSWFPSRPRFLHGR